MNAGRILTVIAMLLVVVGGSNFYLAKRIHQFLRHFFPKLPVSVMIGLFFLLVLVLTLGFARSMLPLPAPVKQALGVANAGWMGIFIYLLLSFALADAAFLLVRLFCPVDRFPFLAAALILTAAVCCYGFSHAAQIRQKDYDITVPGAQDMTVVLISDLHLGAVGSEKRLPEIVHKINALEPDLVCIAGDFFDSDYAAIRDPEAAEATLKALRATWGVWACLGNHDAGATARDMRAFLERCGIGVLQDEYTVLDGKIVLAGRLDGAPIGGYGGLTRQPLSLEGADAALPVIVMDHNPAFIHEYGPEYDLILCGHTHRGQLFPASLVTDWMYTVDYGYYRADADSPQVIVSSGVGTWGMPMRVGTDSELVKIHLHP